MSEPHGSFSGDIPLTSENNAPFFSAIGGVTTAWGELENQIKWHASNLSFQERSKYPYDDLETSFKTLRNFWFKCACKNIPDKVCIINQLNNKLVSLSKKRNSFVHGRWIRDNKSGQYALVLFRQKKEKLSINSTVVSIEEILTLRSQIIDAVSELKSISQAAS